MHQNKALVVAIQIFIKTGNYLLRKHEYCPFEIDEKGICNMDTENAILNRDVEQHVEYQIKAYLQIHSNCKLIGIALIIRE